MTREILLHATGDRDATEELASSRYDLTEYDCYEAAVAHYDNHCYKLGRVSSLHVSIPMFNH